MRTENVLHFPDGRVQHWVNLTYCYAQFNLGEKIIIEGEPQVYVVTDIQNQFREMPTNEAGTELKMIMRNVILEYATPCTQNQKEPK